MKYKVGDKVRVRKDLSCGKSYGYHSFGRGMVTFRGKEMTICRVLFHGYELLEDDFPVKYTWTDEMFEPIHNEKIVITTDGVTTTAKKYDGKKVIKEAKAVCSKDDEFSFDVGAKLAMERLLEEKPKLYNGKVVCVDTNCTELYTKGKIYQFKNGVAYDNTGSRFTCCLHKPIASFDEIKGAAEWLEVVE